MTRKRPATPAKSARATCERTSGIADRALCLAAIAARDAAFDGRFVYSVATTGVYCRPSCPSRGARPENIALHAACGDAENAGFRPCKRCRPDVPHLRARQAERIAAACRQIETAESSPPLAALASAAGLSPHHFHRLFKSVTGVTPKAYAQAQRRARVQEGLAAGASVTAALHQAGYNAASRFYAEAGAALGMRPGGYRTGGAGAELRFAVGVSSLGAVLVAASDKGVAAILIGEDGDVLRRDLARRFPRAHLVAEDAAFAGVIAQVVSTIEEPAAGLDLPLDVRGTAFQQRVWQELQRIPVGATATYAEVAARIGRPEAARAVAGACAANAHAVAIPCHRVVRGDGSLSGYRWGVARKAALIAREQGAHGCEDDAAYRSDPGPARRGTVRRKPREA